MQDPLPAFLSAVRKEVKRRLSAALHAGRIPDFQAEYDQVDRTDPVATAALAYLAGQQRGED